MRGTYSAFYIRQANREANERAEALADGESLLRELLAKPMQVVEPPAEAEPKRVRKQRPPGRWVCKVCNLASCSFAKEPGKRKWLPD